MSLTLSGTDGVVGAGFTLDASGASVTAGVGTFGNSLIGGHAKGNNDSSKLSVFDSSSNIGILQVHCGTESLGTLTGITFGQGGTTATARAKSAIAAEGSGTYGRVDLCLYVDGTADNNPVSVSDEKIRIKSNGRIGIGTTTPSTIVDAIGTVRATSFTATQPEYLRVAHTDNSHNQTKNDNSTHTVQFGSTYDDTKSGWTSGADNYYEIQETGYFLITTQAVLTSNDTNSLRDWALGIEQSTDNGSSYSLLMNNGGRGGGTDSTDTDTVTPSVTIVQYLSAGTRIRVRAHCNTDGGTWQVDEDLGDATGGNDYGGSGFDNQKGTRLFIMRLF